MKTISMILLFLGISLPSFSQSFAYTYDNSGNRISRYVVTLKSHEALASDTVAPVVAEMLESRISVFPVPTEGALQIVISKPPDETQGSITVWDLQGKEILKQSSIQASNTLDFRNQPRGTYIMHILLNGEKSEWKVVRE